MRRAQAVQDTQDTGPGLQYTPAIWVDTVSGERVSQCCDIITPSEHLTGKVVFEILIHDLADRSRSMSIQKRGEDFSIEAEVKL